MKTYTIILPRVDTQLYYTKDWAKVQVEANRFHLAFKLYWDALKLLVSLILLCSLFMLSVAQYYSDGDIRDMMRRSNRKGRRQFELIEDDQNN